MRRLFCGLVFMLLGACATAPTGRLDSYEIVDCELPGAVLHIGTAHATTGRSRAIRTSADDCAIRGGYFTQASQANYETALRVWLPPAEDGDPEAQYYVGQIYEKGLGRPADEAKAAQWYKRAADSNYGPALTALAMLYEHGKVAGGTAAQALDLYRRAAKLDQPLAFASDMAVRDEEIAALKQQLSETRAQAATQREQLQKQQRALAQQTSALRSELAKARADADAERARRVEEELAAKQKSLDSSAAQLSAAETKLAQADAAVRQVEQPAPVAGAAKDLEIVLLDPKPIALRGLVTIRVRGDAKSQAVAVRVGSPSGIREVTINGKALKPDAEGVVRTELALAGKTTPVEVAVVDGANKRASLPFVIANDSLLPAGTPVAANPAGFGNYYALVIGNARYSAWDALNTPHSDAQAVADLLRDSYGFKTTVLLDATRGQIFRALAQLRRQLTEQDNLLVYYSGHGTWDRGNHQGYWVPVDGEKDSVANFVSSADVTDLLSVMRAKQILVVADSCYSGVFVHSVAEQLEAASGAERDAWLLKRSQIPSRKVMSSGNIREVLDGGRGNHSIFAAEFIDALRRRSDKPFEARELYREITPKVEEAARGFGEQQEPQYGQLRFAGHVGGDFVFVPRANLVSVR
ncbi:caspase family protein [Tahibacter amnicola]|uniref:Caspase family protein n=1 Tax=Tahibacter amnicola TaxID=2976241 RepID=A0ABY6BEM9_9GAMM|nr:caspase family protein [Tahibacter amnicola]UXI68494.1 caspase family protein [Tahibacter amnicola]